MPRRLLLACLLPLTMLATLARAADAPSTAGTLFVVPLITEAMQGQPATITTDGGLFVVPLVTEAVQPPTFAAAAEDTLAVVPLITEAMQKAPADATASGLFVVPLVTEAMQTARVSPVPEPASWCLALAGGLLLAALRLKRRVR